jgi:CDP-diacylglycerol---serine O-phosphatidyltransferase
MLRKFIPNFITCLNLLAGCLAIIAASNEKLLWASYLIGLAAIFDFLDGALAKLLKGQSEFGKQLDSLADVVTFGVVPGLILFHLISIGFDTYFTPLHQRSLNVILLSSVGFLVTIFAALRLAKFNIDTKQSDSFIGMPTPAVAIFIASFIPILELMQRINPYIPLKPEMLEPLRAFLYFDAIDLFVINLLFNPYFHVIVSIALSILMISNLPLLSLKFKSFKLKYIYPHLILLLISIWLIWDFEYIGVPLIIIAYIIISLLNAAVKNIFLKNGDLKTSEQTL